MTTQTYWYSIEVSIQDNYCARPIIKKYYFGVNDNSSIPSDDLVYVFYDYDNIGINIIENGYIYFPLDMKAQIAGLLLQIGAVLRTPLSGSPITLEDYISNRVFDRSALLFSQSGVNFSDVKLQSLLNTNTPYFNFYQDENGNIQLYSYVADKTGQNTDDSYIVPTNYINICEIPHPPDFLKSMLKKYLPGVIVSLGTIIASSYIFNKLYGHNNNNKTIIRIRRHQI